MAKWVRHFFRGTRADGSYFVMSGPAYRGLALVRIEKGVYYLTHMRSGNHLHTIEGDYADVRKYAETIADLTDWEALETREAIMASPGLADRVRGVAALYNVSDAESVGHA